MADADRLLLGPQLGLSTGVLTCGLQVAWASSQHGSLGVVRLLTRGRPGPTAGVPVCKVLQTALQNTT